MRYFGIQGSDFYVGRIEVGIQRVLRESSKPEGSSLGFRTAEWLSV